MIFDDRVLLSTEQAAAALGVSVITVRRQIKAGKLRAVTIQGKRGPEYRVELAGDHLNADQDRPDRRSGDRRSEHRSANTDQSTLRLIALLEASQAETRRLQDERAELYGRLGFYQAQLDQAKDRLLALEAPKAPVEIRVESARISELTEPDPPRRPWWRFWR